MTTSTRTCPRCSAAIAEGVKFCNDCGAPISGVFSGGGTPVEGTAVISGDQVDKLAASLQAATIGEYDLYGQLGLGGMAAVYLALDLALNRKVAIKTMRPELVERAGMVQRFKREAQTAAALSHPNIIQIHSVKETKDIVYFVMKYIEGRSLESIVLELGAMEVNLARLILAETADALAFAHKKGVVHRDIKPANIMIEEDGRSIVTDFGIAKVQEAQNLTATGTAIGTPHYMSPEQIHNKTTGASDQYSLGVVAYEMLGGRKPFEGATYPEIIAQHLFEPPPDLRSVRPDIPPDLADAVTRMLQKDPAHRFPDLDAVSSALGLATKAETEKARAQMIALTRGRPEKRPTMSVPQSPVPKQRAAESAAATVVETQASAPRRVPTPPPAGVSQSAPTVVQQTPAATPVAKKEKSKAPMMAGAAGGVILLVVVTLFAAKQMHLFDGTQSKADTTGTREPSLATPTAANAAPPATADSAGATAPPPKANVRQTASAADAKTGKPADKTANAKAPVTPPNSNESKVAAVNTVPATQPAPANVAPAPAPKPAGPTTRPLTIGARQADVVLFIDGVAQGTLSGLKTFMVPVKDVKISLQAPGCTTLEIPVAAGTDSTNVGIKRLTCG